MIITISIGIFVLTFGTFFFHQIVHNETFGVGTEFFPEIIEVLFGITRYVMYLGRYVFWTICAVLMLLHVNAILSGDQQRLMLQAACVLMNITSAYFCYWAYLENVRS